MGTLHARLTVAGLAVAALCLGATGLSAQKVTPAELATRVSGTWKLNREKSAVAAPRGGGAGGGRQGGARRYEVGGLAAVPGAFGQRGGGGGTNMDDLSPAERAAILAMRNLQAVADPITITATADAVTFKDVRGERTFPITDKNVKMDIDGASIQTRTKWDKETLKVDFQSPQTKVSHIWEPSADGKELVFTLRIEAMNQNGLANPPKAYYDRQ